MFVNIYVNHPFGTIHVLICLILMERQAIIKVEHLAKKFGSFEAVKDVSFTVNKLKESDYTEGAFVLA